ncbi:MAG: hypothetical protein AAFZ09_01315 [Pseudomonadota bacterium]
MAAVATGRPAGRPAGLTAAALLAAGATAGEAAAQGAEMCRLVCLDHQKDRALVVEQTSALAVSSFGQVDEGNFCTLSPAGLFPPQTEAALTVCEDMALGESAEPPQPGVAATCGIRQRKLPGSWHLFPGSRAGAVKYVFRLDGRDTVVVQLGGGPQVAFYTLGGADDGGLICASPVSVRRRAG